MAQNVGERHIEDTPANRQLFAVSATMDMAMHTVKICSNPNVFTPAFDSIVQDIVHSAVNAYIYAYDANNISARSTDTFYKENGQERIRLERLAIRECSKLIGYATLAKRLFKLRGKKVKYWIGLILTARSYLHKWEESEIKRFK